MNFLKQTKLTRDEWTKMEKPIQNENEKNILKMIYEGYNDACKHHMELDEVFNSI